MPKNDGEKWPRFFFEIPDAGYYLIPRKEDFCQKSQGKNITNNFPEWHDFKINFFLDHFFTIMFETIITNFAYQKNCRVWGTLL